MVYPPIMAYHAHSMAWRFGIDDVDDVSSDRGMCKCRGVERFVCSAIAKHIRNEQTIPSLAEIIDLVVPLV